MTEDHFGLTGRPFALTPDPDFWFESATHKKAMAYLAYGLAQGEGFIVITGEVGAGKTTLTGRLLQTVDPERLKAISLVSTQLGAEETLRAIAGDLGVTAAEKAGLLAGIERSLHTEAREGRRVLLVVDEAQNLASDAVEELRMLSNFQLGPDPLVQILLLGQPEFRDRLATDPALEPVRQRVIAAHHLGAMNADEVGPYLIHRLSAVGWAGRPDFTDEAVDAIHGWSGGLPRRVNTLAGRAMLAAGLEGADVIDGEIIERVIDDLAADAPTLSTGQSTPSLVPPASDDAQLRRLEERVDAQDKALRHVLKLLVDWMETAPERSARSDANVQRLRGAA